MKKIVLLYWGKGGNVERVAKKMFTMFTPELTDMYDVASFDVDTINSYDLVILGGGGHARVLLDAVFSRTPGIRIAILDPRLVPGAYAGFSPVEIVGDDNCAPRLVRANPGIGFAVGIGSLGPSAARVRLFEIGTSFGMRPYSVIHASAVVSPSAVIADGVQVMAGAVVNPFAKVGSNAVINTRAVVEHDCVVEDHANIASGTVLCGSVIVGGGAFVGAGAVVIQGVRIGKGSVVGAGSVVIRDVDAGARVAGVPAKQLRDREKQA